LGIILEQVNQTDAVGYPANGDANYAGLCNFACAAGYCPPQVLLPGSSSGVYTDQLAF